ncbi:threonine dehydratase (plasmid) [Deinococcus aetherius]|uniref:Threonine dehydratase n=1 Tax=Deinococcus aetherius TaxID=200252 RepID=A0ABN6RQG2_9DEIO|nr:pyridoxal-phosphate dependent enzyme [Deinococcus aetherius]BDP43882.1 threonine dehydratase [Deinococcus aetherius]
MPLPHRVTLARVEEAARTIDPVFLDTPQYSCEALGELIGVHLLLKVETLGPIRSFKGRGADFLVSQVNDDRPLLCASAGNLGQAMAYACRKRGVGLTVYASTRANHLKLDRIRALGARVVLHGEDFDAAKLEAARVAAEGNARLVVDSLDIETLEGAATIGLELLKLPQPLDVVLVALGNGALFNGIARVMKARSPGTRVVAVGAQGAPAMIESWQAGRVIEHERVNTIADGLAVRVPIPEALEDMQGLVDDVHLVSEEVILRAMRLIHEHAGLVVEPSAAVGVAALLEHTDLYRGRAVGTVLCGGNLTPEQMRLWLGPVLEVQA